MDHRALGAAAAVVGVAFGARALVRRSRAYDFHGKTVLVTGGSRGLGLALARQFGEAGARLAICAREETELETARRDLEGRGFEVFAAPCDVTVREDVEHFVSRVCEIYGQIDVLVNNAGVIEVGPVDAMELDDFEEAMGTHFYGPLYFTLAVLPEMQRRRDGRIINISSFGGLVAVPHLLPYTSSKFAATGFSEGLRAEASRDNVIVTTVCPGLVRTGSPVRAFFKGHALSEFRWFVAGGATPGVAMSAERAAKRIVRASSRGRAMLILTPQAKLAAKFHMLFPELTNDLLELADRMLPSPENAPSDGKVEGLDLEPPRGGSIFDRLNRFAARRYNEYATT